MIFNIIYRICLWVLGWKTVGKVSPDIKKFIVLVVPHTSNWDFLIGILGRRFIGLTETRYLIKKDYFDNPFKFFFKWSGGIPVDRSKNTNLVDQVVEEFNKSEKMGLAITPEGTRSLNKEWKTGFYHIAMKAKIPLIFGYIDFFRKEIGVSDSFYPTGNMEEDLIKIKEFYKSKIPKHPEKSSLDHVIPSKKKNLIKKSLSHSKPFLKTMLLLIIGFLIWNFSIVWYGIKQGYGQLYILFNAQPIETFLNDDSFPQPSKEKILLIQEIRKYAFDSLGLDHTNSYTKMFDQKGEPILWLLTACEPYALKAQTWNFPIIGTFSYKGFFDKEKAVSERKKFDTRGYDTNIREVNGWSTLGILNDPILSNMLSRDEGDLANLIIHELTHGTLFMKNNLSYNENLASFVGDEGAKRFLQSKYGKDSKEYQRYLDKKTDREEFTRFILDFTKKLDNLYNSFPKEMTKADKQQSKKNLLATLNTELNNYQFINPNYYKYFEGFTPNNTYFMSYKRYKAKQNIFKEEFENEFNGDFKKYMSYLKKKYPSLF